MAKSVCNDEKLELEVRLRFHPTDEELISQYLTKKVANSNFNASAIAEVDMNKKEPLVLPGLAKMGDTEWYFFSLRVKKYSTGLRTNRATVLGYWKATGKDKQIIEEHALIGTKKTLVFYIGRAPKGVKTNWIMNEYRLEDNKYDLPQTEKGEWVICKVYKKTNRGRKVEIAKFGPSPSASLLPSLMETSSYTNGTIKTTRDLSHVTCFSDLITTHNQEVIENNIVNSKETPIWNFSSFDVSPLANETPPLVFNQPPQQVAQQIGNARHGDFGQPKEQSMLRMLMENDGSSVMVNQKVDFSLGKYYDAAAAHISPVVNKDDMLQMWTKNQEHSSAASMGPFDFDCSWNY